ncbi:MAG: hypothetical protein K0S12_722 [Bacteroidetes bacterium]|jgi:hypothetical protein|nr:hypothetical protein [Bacteroidota bacterium]
MQQIKRNSDEFKTVKKIITDPSNKAARMRSILLYSLKSENSLEDAVILNKEKKNAAVLYNLAYESLQTYFDDTSKKLFRDEKEDIYYFKSSAKSKWMEFPFSFKGKFKKSVEAKRPVKLRIV